MMDYPILNRCLTNTNKMEHNSFAIRHHIWDTLFSIFNSHSKGQSYLTPAQLQGIIREILGAEGQAQVAYVVKNMNQIDSNNNGRIEFGEFTNYLLKRHCGELALQRLHKARLIENELQMHLTGPEFLILLRTAFSFLGVTIPGDAIDEIFAITDVDRDGTISYTEYFKFIETYICDFQTPHHEDKQAKLQKRGSLNSLETCEMLRRFRRLLWGQLFRIYIKYDTDGNGNMDNQEMTLLLKELLNETTKSQLDYVFLNRFRMDQNQDNCFVFEEFATFFIRHSCQIGLNRFNRARNIAGKRDISRSDFGKLFKNSFCFLQNGLIGQKIISRVFNKIDKDRDGSISYKQYLQWTNELLAYREMDGLPCFLYEHKIQQVLDPTPLKIKDEEKEVEDQAPSLRTPTFALTKPYGLEKTNVPSKPPLPPGSRNSIITRPSNILSPKNPDEALQRDTQKRFIDSRGNNTSEDSRFNKSGNHQNSSLKFGEQQDIRTKTQVSGNKNLGTPDTIKNTPTTWNDSNTPNHLRLKDLEGVTTNGFKLEGETKSVPPKDEKINSSPLDSRKFNLQENTNEQPNGIPNPMKRLTYDNPTFSNNSHSNKHQHFVKIAQIGDVYQINQNLDQPKISKVGQFQPSFAFSLNISSQNNLSNGKIKQNSFSQNNTTNKNSHLDKMVKQQSGTNEGFDSSNNLNVNYSSIKNDHNSSVFSLPSSGNKDSQNELNHLAINKDNNKGNLGQLSGKFDSTTQNQTRNSLNSEYFEYQNQVKGSPNRQNIHIEPEIFQQNSSIGKSHLLGGIIQELPTNFSFIEDKGYINANTRKKQANGEHQINESFDNDLSKKLSQQNHLATEDSFGKGKLEGRKASSKYDSSSQNPENFSTIDDISGNRQLHLHQANRNRSGAFGIRPFDSYSSTEVHEHPQNRQNKSTIVNQGNKNNINFNISNSMINSQHKDQRDFEFPTISIGQLGKSNVRSVYDKDQSNYPIKSARDRIQIDLPYSNHTANILATRKPLNVGVTPRPNVKLFENPRVQPLSISRVESRRPSRSPSDAASIRSSARSKCSMPKLFTSYGLAQRIKRHTLKLLKTFNKDNSNSLKSQTIDEILKSLLRQNQFEISYVKKNYFRYSMQRKDIVTYEMFTQFFLGLHCGEMSVQRLHKADMFSKSKELFMNEKEFIMSFQGALDYVDFLAPIGELRQVFKEIDTDQDQWITYKEYFEFLKHFFTYLPASTIKAISNNPSLMTTPMTSPLHSARSSFSQNQEPEDVLSALIRSQTISIINKHCNSPSKQFSNQNIRSILKTVFGALPVQIDHITRSLHKYDSNDDGMLTTDEFANFVMEKYCGDIVLQRLHSGQRFMKFEERVLGMHDFLMLFETAFAYIDFKPKKEEVMQLFKDLDTDYDGYIAYKKYPEFIREYLGTYKHEETERKRSLPTSLNSSRIFPGSLSETRSRNTSGSFLKA